MTYGKLAWMGTLVVALGAACGSTEEDGAGGSGGASAGGSGGVSTGGSGGVSTGGSAGVSTGGSAGAGGSTGGAAGASGGSAGTGAVAGVGGTDAGTDGGCPQKTVPTKDGCLSCKEAIDKVNAAVLAAKAAHDGCVGDGDCTTAGLGTQCQGSCPTSVATAELAAYQAALAQIGQDYCGGYVAVCGYITPSCLAGTPKCVSKHCEYVSI